jgi:hypothetical protein
MLTLSQPGPSNASKYQVVLHHISTATVPLITYPSTVCLLRTFAPHAVKSTQWAGVGLKWLALNTVASAASLTWVTDGRVRISTPKLRSLRCSQR